jgi:hypothetical protein
MKMILSMPSTTSNTVNVSKDIHRFGSVSIRGGMAVGSRE